MLNNQHYVEGDPNMLWDRFLKGAEVTEEEFEKWYGGKKNVDNA